MNAARRTIDMRLEMKKGIETVVEQAKTLGFTAKSVSFDSGVIVLSRGDALFRFEGISNARDAIRLAAAAVARERLER